MIILSLKVIIMKIESKVINLLAKDVEKRFTINEISKNIGVYYSFVHKTVNKLAKDKIIEKNKAGKSYLCSLNLRNEKTMTLIQMSEIEKREKFYTANKEFKLILEDFVKSVLHQKNIKSVILFGSYSKDNATSKSDIDILIINGSAIKIERIIKEIYAKYGKEINPLIMTQKDFKKQIKEPVIKEIIKDHHILYGVENFVNMVFGK